MSACLYLDTSAVLRATLEAGASLEVEQAIAEAESLVTSRLSLVESARAILRVEEMSRLPAAALADVRRQIDAVWARCDIWELTPAICEAACLVAPRLRLRALDAVHLATYLAARRRIEGLELLTLDARLRSAGQ